MKGWVLKLPKRTHLVILFYPELNNTQETPRNYQERGFLFSFSSFFPNMKSRKSTDIKSQNPLKGTNTIEAEINSKMFFFFNLKHTKTI